MRAQFVVLLGHQANDESLDPERASRLPEGARLGNILAVVPPSVNGSICNRRLRLAIAPVAERLVQYLVGNATGLATRPPEEC